MAKVVDVTNTMFTHQKVMAINNRFWSKNSLFQALAF